MRLVHSLAEFFFFKCSLGGEIAFVGQERKCEKYPAGHLNLLLFGEGRGGGDIPKGPEKSLPATVL